MFNLILSCHWHIDNLTGVNWCCRAVNFEIIDKYVQHLVDFGVNNVFGEWEHLYAACMRVIFYVHFQFM